VEEKSVVIGHDRRALVVALLHAAQRIGVQLRATAPPWLARSAQCQTLSEVD
jgi:hypothetical protein